MLTSKVVNANQYENYLNDDATLKLLKAAARQTMTPSDNFYEKRLSYVHCSAAAGQVKIEATNSTRALIYTCKIDKNVSFDKLISVDSIRHCKRDASLLQTIDNKKGLGAYPDLTRFIHWIKEDATIKVQFTAGELLPLLKGFKAAINSFYQDYNKKIYIPFKNAVTMNLKQQHGCYIDKSDMNTGIIKIYSPFMKYGVYLPCKTSGISEQQKDFTINFNINNLVPAAAIFDKNDNITMYLTKTLRPIELTNNSGLYAVSSPIRLTNDF